MGTAPRYPRPDLTEPIPHEYLYAGLTVDPPAHAPFVRGSARRDRVLDRCRDLVRELRAVDGVVEARVFEAVLIPPLEGMPRFDVTVLVRATTVEALDQVQRLDAWKRLDAGLVMPARNTLRIGDTERTRSATFLFNHFTAHDASAAVEAWEGLTGWYTAKTGVDNSTLLRPTGRAPYAFVNYVRLPHGAVSFMLSQFGRPSFHTYVRRVLRENGMVALPLLCKPA